MPAARSIGKFTTVHSGKGRIRKFEGAAEDVFAFGFTFVADAFHHGKYFEGFEFYDFYTASFAYTGIIVFRLFNLISKSRLPEWIAASPRLRRSNEIIPQMKPIRLY